MYKRVAKRKQRRKRLNFEEYLFKSDSNYNYLSRFDVHLNVPNLINTSPRKMSEYKAKKQKLFYDEKPINFYHNYQSNYFVINNIFEPYNTVFVSRFGRQKPYKEEIYNNFINFGAISELITDPNEKYCSYAFIRFESSQVAYNLCQSSNVKFSYRDQIDVDISVNPRLDLCNTEGFDSIANFTPIDRKHIFEKLLSANDLEQKYNILRNELMLTEEDCNQRFHLINKLESILSENGFNCKFHIFGSTVNKLGFRDTDIDVFIELLGENNLKERMNYTQAIRLLKIIRNKLKNRLNMFIPHPIESKRCPVLRLDFKHFSHNLRTNGIVCDLTLSNSLGIRNSSLISLFCQIEPKFHVLAIILRYLWKLNRFIGSSKMSSYAFTMLIVFFCQKLKLLPTVDLLIELSSPNVNLIINGIQTWFTTDVELLRTRFSNHNNRNLSISYLLQMFFKFYSEFDFARRVICPRFGKSVSKEEFNRLYFKNNVYVENDTHFKMTSICCIQDPFDPHFNLSGHMRYDFFCSLINYFKLINENHYLYFNENQNIEQKEGFGFNKLFEVKNNFNDHYEDISEDENEVIFCDLKSESDSLSSKSRASSHLIGKVDIKFDSNHSNSQSLLEQKLNEMSENFTKFVKNLLSLGYQFECNLIYESGIKLGQISNFSRFECKFRSNYDIITDYWKRDSVVGNLKTELQNVGCIEFERKITEELSKQNANTVHKSLPIHLDFEFILDTISSPFKIYLKFSSIKPNLFTAEYLIKFIIESISSKVKSQDILVIDDDIFIIHSK